MTYKAEIPYGAYWSTPFARWQGSFANLHSIEFAAHVARNELAKRNIDPKIFDYGALGFSVPQKHSFYGLPWLTGLIGAGQAGGPTLIQMLNALGHFNLAALGHNSPRYIDLVGRVMQWAFADWTTRLGDPEFTTDLTDEIMSPTYAADAAERIRDGAKFRVPRLQPPEPKDTTHINVVDRWGNIVSLTHSLGFSSGVVVDGLGFQLNNAMNCFHPLPGRANSIAPGKARLTGLCPTLVLRDGEPIIAIGAPGGSALAT